MLSFTKITGVFFQTDSRTGSHRRRSSTCLGLEALEGRDLMSAIGAPNSAPPPSGVLPPTILPPGQVVPPTSR
jgi:hypothetical protein